MDESDGVAIIQIGVIRGRDLLERQIIINVEFSTNPLSAASKLHETRIAKIYW